MKARNPTCPFWAKAESAKRYMVMPMASRMMYLEKSPNSTDLAVAAIAGTDWLMTYR